MQMRGMVMLMLMLMLMLIAMLVERLECGREECGVGAQFDSGLSTGLRSFKSPNSTLDLRAHPRCIKRHPLWLLAHTHLCDQALRCRVYLQLRQGHTELAIATLKVGGRPMPAVTIRAPSSTAP